MELMKNNKGVFGSEEASLVVDKLKETFLSGKTMSYEWRLSQLKGLMKILDHHEPDIIKALYSDLSKPPTETIAYEISTVRSSIEFAMKELKRWMEPEKVKNTILSFPSSVKIIHEPLGVVLVISAWNFPFYLSLEPVIGAISAGNAVVLKPSEISPSTSSLLAELFLKYMDTSAIEVVEGGIPQTSALLEQKWDKILFTGNENVGRIVMTAGVKHLTPVILELGGKCPAFVDSNINLKVAIRRIIAGKWTMNNGQACICVDYVITTKDFAPKLIDALKSELEIFFGKNPMESEDLSRIVNLNHFRRIKRLLDDDKLSGKIVHGGQSDESKLKMAPTIILLDVTDQKEALVMKEEIFGPLLPIIQVESIEKGFEMMKFKEKPLAAYLFTNDNKLKDEFVEKVSAGGLLINDVALHVAHPYLPFGGVGKSGFGAYHGKFSFECFSHKKGVLSRSFAGDTTARYPPYTPGKLRMLKALLSGRIFTIIRALLGI
ncbi:aldehyde dehydrogenase family 3 member H1-like [Impatiens glandulifera]|uniref:aldehyde dehydrogenase family 3 member H1-like n=1 Tax=Impatiens glandulifera TaxID=253017 RepID=UPI001FB150DC|nr:aldehyde dehydrogenase family 3 member H1-like [Impatiens glandulifera]